MKDATAFSTIDGDFSKGMLLICDHANNHIPDHYNQLGLADTELQRHIAYDIGAEQITKQLAKILNLPAVLAGFSRLLIDVNRGEDDPTLIRQIYDGTIIPGNYPLTKSEAETRIKKYYRPYHQAISAHLARFSKFNIIPAVFSIHTMTDYWNGQKRPWQISILWDSDPRLVHPILEMLKQNSELTIGDNQPYDGALGNDTLYQHCTSNGLAHALVEVRQDLVSTNENANQWAKTIAPILEKANQLEGVHEIRHYPSRSQ